MALAWPEPHRRATNVWGSPIAWLIPPLAVLIGGIGVATLYSVAGGSMDPWAMRHVIRLIIGFALLFGLVLVPADLWLRLAYPIYLVALVLVATVLVRGTQALGAQRWLVLGPVSVQPSEMMKFALILVLARYFHRLSARSISRPLAVLVPLVLVVLPVVLILRQPDLGTAVLLGLTGLSLIFLAGAPLQYFLLGGGAVAAVAPVFWALLHGYQKERLLVFWDPAIDPLGRGYQIFQSKIALGSGGLVGKGFLQGTQTQLDFVPEKHTDFVFALWAEETGFVGSAMLIGLFLALVWCLIVLALRSRSIFSRLLISGVAMSLFLHVFVNISMVVGLAPVVGVPLPLISYGGTSLFSLLIGLGIALGVSGQAKDIPRAANLERLRG
jgi:rod shape determining protein RodA